MRLSIVLALAFLGLWSFAACARAGPAAYSSGTINVKGVARSYLIHVPASYDASHPAALVLNFHGGGGTPEGQAQISVMNPVSDAHGFIVVYPRGIDKHWNDSRSELANKPDDVAFVSALIDTLEAQYRIDPKRVYATGHSNGAIFSLRLACDLSDKIAAIAPVNGSMPTNLPNNCRAKPMSVMLINGLADPLVPFGGGYVGGRGPYAGNVISVPSTAAFWAKKDGCSASPLHVYLPKVDPNDGTTTTRDEYTGCSHATSVQLYAVDGGGHTWPGGLQYLPATLVGRTSRDFNASEAIWQFFAAHPRLPLS